MTPERWQKVFALVKASLQQDEGERLLFVARNCEGDEEIRSAAQSLLLAQEEMGSFLEQSGTQLAFANQFTEQFSFGGNDEPTLTGKTSPSTAPEFRALSRGAILGRYVVLDLLGTGGMGVVYAAYDPELDRKLAIKLLHPEVSKSLLGSDGKARLLREAQAMARLSHTNVIAVHDVGTIGDEVFIAMEYVDGCTLKQWLEVKHPWPDIVAMFVQAGRGLWAAHSAGIVHRDFKPDNVLVGKDGRAQVLDFGLARGSISAETAQTIQLISDGQSDQSIGPKPLAEGVTKAGALMGTPAYMAPEQMAGGQVDARTDQFSFCAALYQALYGELPFEGHTLPQRLTAIQQGHLRSPKASKVPGWLRHVVAKGLQAEPASRYPSMEALLQKLEQNPAKFWRQATAVAAMVLLVALAPWVSYRVVAHRQSLVCRGAEDKLAGIWDAPKQEAIQKAFLATAKPYATDAFNGIKRALDAKAQSWVAMHTDACQATRLRQEQSEALLDLRIGCLQGRLEEMRALTDLFAKADTQVVEKAVEAAHALTPLRGCADAAALTAQVKPPADAATRAQVEKQRATLAEIKVLKDTGKYARGLDMAKQVEAAARETHYKPLEVESLLMLGQLLQLTDQPREAEETLNQAVTGADAVGDDQRRAQAWTQLALVVGYRELRIEEGLRLTREASAVVERLGSPPDLDSELQHVLGTILLRQGKYTDALQRLKLALDIRQRALGPEHPDVARTLAVIGTALKNSGRYEESLAYLQKALQISEKALGSEHPNVAYALNILGSVLRRQGNFDAALEAQKRALAIREKVFGPEDTEVSRSLSNVGLILKAQGRYAEARSFLQRALEIDEKRLGPEHGDLSGTLANLGNLLYLMGDFDSSLAYFRRALAIAEKTFGPEHRDVAMSLNGIGAVLTEQGNLQSALEHFRRALAIKEKVLGAEHPELTTTLANLAIVVHQQNKTKNFGLAISYLKRALAIQEKAGSMGDITAGILGDLGRYESERKLPRALGHLQRALEIREKTLPADSPLIGVTLSQMGEAYLNFGQPGEAKIRLERALKLLEPSQRARSDLGWTQFQLARAMWETRSSRERAIALAQESRAIFSKEAKSQSQSQSLREVEGWLSKRRMRVGLSARVLESSDH